MNSEHPTRQLALLLLMACSVLTCSVVGCGYGEVSPMTYEYAKALYGVANRRAVERLDAVAEQVDRSIASGELTPREGGWLIDIVDDARGGDWQAAQRAARRIMTDQITS